MKQKTDFTRPEQRAWPEYKVPPVIITIEP
jgi:hypothetical protein